MSYNIDKTLPPETDLVPGPQALIPTTSSDLKDYPPVLALARIQKQRGTPDRDFAFTIRFEFSGSSWGKIKAGTFNGNIGKAITAVKRALAFAQSGRVIESDGDVVVFDYIADAVASMEIARASRDEHKLTLVVGASGSGKSATLNYLHHKFGGDLLNAHPDWSHSYMAELTGWAEGIGLTANFRTVREAQRAILDNLKSRPRSILVDEANYFSRDGLNFVKAICNETECPIALGTLPNDLRRLNAEHNYETRQVIRRAVAIIAIPPVDSATVSALHLSHFPQLTLNGYAPQVASLANKYHRIDTVMRVFAETDPEDPQDIPSAIQRVERSIKVEGIK